MGVDSKVRTPVSVRNKHVCCKAFFLVTVFTFALMMPKQFAWSFDPLDLQKSSQKNQPAPLSYINEISSLPSTIADTCLPLLQSIRQTNALSVMVRNQRAAGQVTALSLVLGVRYALSPALRHSGVESRIGLRQPVQGFAGGQHAEAVAQYRLCQKEQALASSRDSMKGF